ncbi:aldo/keto reductase [Nonomuraea sp. NPDC049480]|uniref:aldo/keto reductase n=1 Tax=Nonomuraea sp. NPDC049480 TaxID=3364353 RepID=UPI003791B468
MTTTSTTFALGGDLQVDRLGFGAMRLVLNGFNGPSRDRETALAVLTRAVELGVNHIDTAGFYRGRDGGPSVNDLIREALHPYPEDLVMATKVGPVFGPDLGPTGYSEAGPGDLRAQVEANLQALGLDRLDLVYLRIGYLQVPHGDSLAQRFEALAALREEGLIRHLGLSNVDAGHLDEAQRIAPVAAIQNLFNPTDPDQAALLERAATQRIAFVPFGTLGSGYGERDAARDARYGQVAARHGATVTQVAVAQVLALSPATLTIPGTGSVAHLEENVAARSLTLTEQDLRALR